MKYSDIISQSDVLFVRMALTSCIKKTESIRDSISIYSLYGLYLQYIDRMYCRKIPLTQKQFVFVLSQIGLIIRRRTAMRLPHVIQVKPLENCMLVGIDGENTGVEWNPSFYYVNTAKRERKIKRIKNLIRKKYAKNK
jgi:hypothetical protein